MTGLHVRPLHHTSNSPVTIAKVWEVVKTISGRVTVSHPTNLIGDAANRMAMNTHLTAIITNTQMASRITFSKANPSPM